MRNPFLPGPLRPLLLNGRHFDNAAAALGFWIAAILLLLPDVLRSRFLPTVILLFILGLVIVLTKSLPARLVHQDAWERSIEHARQRQRELENLHQERPHHDDHKPRPGGR